MNAAPQNHRCLVFLILLIGITSYGQEKYNHWSIGINGGFHIPVVTGANGISKGRYFGVKQFGFSSRYMVNQKFGVKAGLGYQKLQYASRKEVGVNMYHFRLEGVVNIVRFIDPEINYRIFRKFRLFGHAGPGLSFNKSLASRPSATDHLGSITFGLTEQYKLNGNLSLFTDLSYITLFRQNFGFDGKNFPDNGYNSGSYISFAIGLIFGLGPHDYHADWY